MLLEPGPGRARGADVGPTWGPQSPKPVPSLTQTTPTGPRTTPNCSRMSCRHIHTSATLKRGHPRGVPARPDKPRNCGFDCGLGVGPVFSRSSATRLVLQCRWHPNSARQTTSQTMSCRKKTPVRLDSTSLGLRPLLAEAGAGCPLLSGCRCGGRRCGRCRYGLLRAEKRIPCGSVWISGTSPGALRGKVVEPSCRGTVPNCGRGAAGRL